MPRQNLLIVDGDARNRRVLEVSLRKAGFSITAAASAETALEFLNHAAPDLIISDTRLPGEDGFALCTKIKSDPRWRSIPFIFLTGEKSVDEKVRGLELGVEDYLTKPIWIKEITTRVTMLLQRKQHERIERRDTARTKFTGRLADMAVVDLLQTIEISRKSGVIHFGTELGEAHVWFRDGAVIDAEMGRLQGEAAVYRLLSLGDGDFELEFKPINRSQAIYANTQALLMDGMRRVDEWGRLLEQLPPLDSVLIPDAEQVQARKDDLTQAQVQVLRLFDGRRSIIEVVDHSGEDDLEVLTTIGQCYFEGLLTVPGDGPEPTRDTGSLEPWDVSGPGAGPGSSLDAPTPGPRLEGAFADDTTQPIVTGPELPPPPSYPEPFPQLRTQEEDGLVPGIPEDSAPRPAFGVAMLSLEDDRTGPADGEVLRALRSQLDAIASEQAPFEPEPARSPATLSLVTNGVQAAVGVHAEATDPFAGSPELLEHDPSTAADPAERERLRGDVWTRTLPYGVTSMREDGDLEGEPRTAANERAANEASPQQTLARLALRRVRRVDAGAGADDGATVRERVTGALLDVSAPEDGDAFAAADHARDHDDVVLDDRVGGDDDIELVTDDHVTLLYGDDGEGIAPMTTQVSPPFGVPRAAASGIFDTSSVPAPDPPKLPTFVGDLGRGGLERRLDAELRPHMLSTDEPATLELHHTPREEDEGVAAVKLSSPAQESGPWASRSLRRLDEQETVAVAARAPELRAAPYGALTAAIVIAAVAGFAYGVFTHPAGGSERIAAEDPSTASEVTPDPADAWDAAEAVSRAESLYRAGDLDAARVVVDRLLAFRPDDARALVLRSTMLIESGRLDDALASARAAAQADHELADAQLTLGVIEQERGELEHAAAAYRRYLELSPEGVYAAAIRRQLERVEAKLAAPADAPSTGGASKPVNASSSDGARSPTKAGSKPPREAETESSLEARPGHAPPVDAAPTADTRRPVSASATEDEPAAAPTAAAKPEAKPGPQPSSTSSIEVQPGQSRTIDASSASGSTPGRP